MYEKYFTKFGRNRPKRISIVLIHQTEYKHDCNDKYVAAIKCMLTELLTREVPANAATTRIENKNENGTHVIQVVYEVEN